MVATIDWYGISPGMRDEAPTGEVCAGLWDYEAESRDLEEGCGLPVAVVTDRVEGLHNRPMCDVHLMLYVQDVFDAKRVSA
ncbi:hypothetical protein [Mycobacterium paraintracellulare]